MISYSALQAEGVAVVRAAGVAILSISAIPGKIYSLYAISSNTSPVYIQAFDLAAMPSPGAWTAVPVLLDLAAGLTTAYNSTFRLATFQVPVPIVHGLQLVLSTSPSSIVLDANPIFLAAQFSPDNLYGGALPPNSGLGFGA